MIWFPIHHLLSDKDYALQLELLSGKKGLSRKVTIPQIQKPGLALAGYTSNINPGRIQILGRSEMGYLGRLSDKERQRTIRKLCRLQVACFIITRGAEPPAILLKETEKSRTPVLGTPLDTPTFVIRVSRFLEDKLTATTSLHGVLIDVFGVGIFLLGKSGIGKSESALELVMKGHRLVADDVVHIQKKSPATLFGMGSELIKYHMEIRGLGIINIKDLFGVTSVRDQKVIELVIELVEWDPNEAYERLGIDEQTFPILDVPVPYLRIPIRPGRSLTSIIEIAARNQLLKAKGFYSAHDFQERLTRVLLEGQKNPAGPEFVE